MRQRRFGKHAWPVVVRVAFCIIETRAHANRNRSPHLRRRLSIMLRNNNFLVHRQPRRL
jgi:hypothetical protein